MINNLRIKGYYRHYIWITVIENMEKFECGIENKLFLKLEIFYS
jgi:hypothetical protein